MNEFFAAVGEFFANCWNSIYDFLNLGKINAFEILLRAVLAIVIGGTIGMERGKQGRAAGMRTHILVCLGAALTAITGEFANALLGTGDPLRIAAQVISGIGFLGVGTILIKGRFQITGLTTAAGLWAAAALGIATGMGFYTGAVIFWGATILTMTLLHRFEYRITHKNTRYGIYVEISGTEHLRPTMDYMKHTYNMVDMQVTPPRSGINGNVGIEAIVLNSKDTVLPPDELAKALEELDEVVFAIESI